MRTTGVRGDVCPCYFGSHPLEPQAPMAHIRLLPDDELTDTVRKRVQATEAAGADASVQRALAHRQDMFDRYFQFYSPAHQGGLVEATLKELVRLKIARLNDCFT